MQPMMPARMVRDNIAIPNITALSQHYYLSNWSLMMNNRAKFVNSSDSLGTYVLV